MTSTSPTPFLTKKVWIVFDDEDTAWIRDAAIQLGATIETSFHPKLDYIFGNTLKEVTGALKKNTTEAKILSKAFLLDVIADSKLPDSFEPYFLDKPILASPKSLISKEDDLPPRKNAAKRSAEENLDSSIDNAGSKISRTENITSPSRASAPTAPSSMTTTEPSKVNISKASPNSGPVSPSFPVLPSSPPNNGVVQPKYSSLNVAMKWETIDGSCLTFSSPSILGSSLVAAFDMDGTLIVPKSGAKFPTNQQDWKWMLPEVVPMIKRLSTIGYKIVIFTNQNGISKGKQKAGDITGKIKDLCENLDVPMQAFCATSGDKFRKPSTDMFQLFCRSYNGGVNIDLSKSFYIGDAAGRPINWAPKRKADHGAGDRKFAANLLLPFKTPEEFFLDQAPANFIWRTVNPSEVVLAAETNSESAQDKLNLFEAILGSIGKKQELVIMIGIPASGKSTFAKKYLEAKGYTRANRDLLGTIPKCVSVVKAALAAGKSAVVDNTNPSVSARADFLALAKQFGVPVRAFWMQTSETIADHCNLYRERWDGTKRIPDIAYNMYRKNFQPPTTGEGFSEIIKVPWLPKFDTPNDRSLFLQWTE